MTIKITFLMQNMHANMYVVNIASCEWVGPRKLFWCDLHDSLIGGCFSADSWVL